jgi:hypothetical protein
MERNCLHIKHHRKLLVDATENMVRNTIPVHVQQKQQPRSQQYKWWSAGSTEMVTLSAFWML